jgi:Cu(I)/Ag(I) efflux system membrane protein CusA/SilA
VIAASVLAAVAGAVARRGLSRDVVPDLSDPQIAVVAEWMGHGATEVAGRVTAVVSSALDGIPGLAAVRGSSMSDMAYVDVVFTSAAHLAAGRAAIVERLAQARARLPPGVRVQVGPAASSAGWVYQYVLVDPARGHPARELRRLQEERLRPALAALPGVAEVASVGGDTQEVIVEARADQLRERALAFSDLAATLGGRLAAGPVGLVGELDGLTLATPAAPGAGGEPTRVRDVARVRVADAMPTGIADLDGILPAVGGIVIAARDANLAAVVGQVSATLARERAHLPSGVDLVTIYNRLELAGRVDRSLVRALVEEIGAVVLVALMFLLHARSALVPLATLPFVLALTFGAMWLGGVPATIMSLGGIGIALGIAVDADVVALEACHRRLEALGPGAPAAEERAALVAAAGSFVPAIVTSLLITALTFLPVFAFTGETGRLLRPLALTKTLVVLAAALVALTLSPALRDRLVRGRVTPELDNPLTRRLVALYEPFVRFALRRPVLTLTTAALAVASVVPLLAGGRLGGEFLPRVDEGDLLFMPTTVPGAAAHDVAGELRRQDHAIARHGEVAAVFGKIGRADTATDPAPLSMAETTVRLRPRAEWPQVARKRWFSGWAPAPLARALSQLWPEEGPLTTAELISALDRAARLPGWSNAWTAPARARLDMMSTGVRTPLAIRIVASDPARLDALGTELRAMAMRVPGARGAAFESLGGEARLDFELDPGALARHGVEPGRARSAADLVLAGGWMGEIRQGVRRMPLRLIPEENVLGPTDQLRAATVRAGPGGEGAPVALALVGRPRWSIRPANLRNEDGALVAYVHVDLEEGADLEGYVGRAREALAGLERSGALTLAPGERIEWTGQYQLLAAGQRRLRWIVPLVVISMLALLFLQFRSWTEALIVLASVPFALVGSFWTLYGLGYPLSAPVWIGLLSVIGLAMQTGVVMVVYIDEAFHRRVREGRLRTREDIVAAHAEGTVKRLRPKLMTVMTMAAGLLPLVWAEGAGGEIMRRIAAPMIGGLVTSSFLTLEVLPVLYTIWRHRQLLRAQRRGVAIEDVVGRIPGWAR